MSPEAPPSLIQYLTLAAAVIAASGPIVKFWEIHNFNRDKIDLSIEWHEGPDLDGRIADHAYLFVHNRSAHDIFVADIFLLYNAVIKKRARGTALSYANPSDLNFPYEIEAGGHKWFRVEDEYVFRMWMKASKFKRFFYLFGRSSVWIGLKTTGRLEKSIGCEKFIDYKSRPEWMK